MASDPFIDEINARLHYLEHSRAADAQPGVTLRIDLGTQSSDAPGAVLYRDLRSEHHATRAKQKEAMVRSVANAVAQERHLAERHQRHTTRLSAAPAISTPPLEAGEGRHEHWREREQTW